METRQEYLNIICNGQPRQVASGTLVADLLRELKLEPGQVAVELDGRILTRHELAVTPLGQGSRLELVRFVGGGCDA